MNDVPRVAPEWLSARLSDRSASAIAAEVGQLIRHEDIPVGAQLPTVRALADTLRVSPATVSSAWQQLRAQGLLVGAGRGGMRAAAEAHTPRPERYESEGNYGDNYILDLRLSVPDPALLPDLIHYLHRSDFVDGLNGYDRTSILPSLAEAVQDRWPRTPRAMMVTNGGYEGLMLVAHTFIRAGDPVLVERPSPPRLLDIVEQAGGRPVPVDRDEEGIVPSSLSDGLRRRPSALVLQPGIQNPDGRIMTPERRDELASLLSGTRVLVIEDDGLGFLASSAPATLAEPLPDQVIHVLSFSKSHGPDLRMAVVEGPRRDIDRVQAFRRFGSGWTSRPLQQALALMLRDPGCDEVVAHARKVYDQRRDALRAELAQRGVPADGAGLDLWVPVHNEQYALVTCAAHGLAVSSGSRFTGPDGPPHIRVSTSQLATDQAASVADTLALATRAAEPRVG
ncbi:aminotransferase class I/II-fold pyridoxal phosphate-dependent enzyme [Mariniluteicoccus endophyticus]